MTRPDDRADFDEGLRSSMPPARYEAVRRWVLSDIIEIRTLRRELHDTIATESSTPLDDLGHVGERMTLVASELAANALEHGRPPTIVTLKSDGTRYLLDVADHDPYSAPVLAGRRTPGAGGFGLQIAREIGQDVGWHTTGTTKHIWVSFSPHD